MGSSMSSDTSSNTRFCTNCGAFGSVTWDFNTPHIGLCSKCSTMTQRMICSGCQGVFFSNSGDHPDHCYKCKRDFTGELTSPDTMWRRTMGGILRLYRETIEDIMITMKKAAHQGKHGITVTTTHFTDSQRGDLHYFFTKMGYISSLRDGNNVLNLSWNSEDRKLTPGTVLEVVTKCPTTGTLSSL